MAVSNRRSIGELAPGGLSTLIDLRGRLSYHQTMSLLRGLFWLVLFVFFTFCFVVLFEYGTHDFTSGFQKEFERVKAFAQEAAKPSPKPKK